MLGIKKKTTQYLCYQKNILLNVRPQLQNMYRNIVSHIFLQTYGKLLAFIQVCLLLYTSCKQMQNSHCKNVMMTQKVEDKCSAIKQLCRHCIHLFCSLYGPETCLGCCQWPTPLVFVRQMWYLIESAKCRVQICLFPGIS